VRWPTELNRQGPNTGTQYRFAIFPANAEQARVAEAYIAQLNKARVFDVVSTAPGSAMDWGTHMRARLSRLRMPATPFVCLVFSRQLFDLLLRLPGTQCYLAQHQPRLPSMQERHVPR
jgi:hypothetical protein